MKRALEFILLPYGAVIGILIAAAIIGGIEYAVASEVSELGSFECTGTAVEKNGVNVRVAMDCEGQRKGLYSGQPDVVVAFTKSQPLKTRCTVHRYQSRVDCE